MSGERYPENHKTFTPTYGEDEEQLPEHWLRFFELREDLLLNYGYNTARAYWSDLDAWFWWAVERDKDVLNLTEQDIKQYVALLRRRKYSESTIRRRKTALRLLDTIHQSQAVRRRLAGCRRHWLLSEEFRIKR